MTKYISFKIFDTKDHKDGINGILDKQLDKDYTVVHEDYYVRVIKASLEEKQGMQGWCNNCGTHTSSLVEWEGKQNTYVVCGKCKIKLEGGARRD